MKSRIVHIIPTLDRAGAEKQLVLLATRLPREEFEVHVCALTRSGPLAEDLAAAGIPVHVIGKRFKADPTAYWRLYQCLKKLQPDLVQTWLFAANAYGRAAARQAGVRRIIAGERCVDPWKARWQLAVDRYLAPRTDRIVVNSLGTRDFYVQHGLPAEKFVYIPNGVLPAAEGRFTREELIRQLGLPAESKLVGAIGRLWPQKRHKDLIWATDLLKTIRDDTHLLIVGDGPLREQLERYCYQVRIEDKVHFLGHRQDVPDLLPLLDVLWLGSGYEGQPNVVLEAMAAGVPVVATNIPGVREIVVDGETGFLVPLGDRAEFARKTRVLLEDPARAMALGQAGQRRVQTEFSVDRMVSAHAALYRELLASDD